MTNDSSRDTGSSGYTRKLSLGAGSLSALYVIPFTTQAGIVHQTSPVSHSVGGNPTSGTTVVDWDVDGNSSIDFNITAIANLSYTGGGSSYYGGSYGGLSRPSGQLQFNSAGGGLGLVQTQGDGSDTFRNLPLNFQVGPALSSPYQWGPAGVQDRFVGATSDYTVFFSQPFSGGGNEFFGFRFDSNGQTLYGWAEVNFDMNFGVGMTIEQWAYDDTGAGIRVGQVSAVPAPPALFSMLSGLALGAGGLLRGRRQRKAEQASENVGVDS